MSAFLKMCATRGATCLLDLELDGQVNPLGHEFLGVLDGDVGVVTVIEISNSTPDAAAADGDALRHGHREGHLGALGGKAEAQPAGAGDQPVKAVLRLGHIAAMNQGLENAVDAGLGDMRLLVNVLQGHGGVILFQQLKHVERLGQNGNQVQPLDLGFRQLLVPLLVFP